MLINVLFTNIYIQMRAGTQARTHSVIYRSTWEVASDEIMSATVCLLYNPHLPQLDVLLECLEFWRWLERILCSFSLAVQDDTELFTFCCHTYPG